MAQHVDVKNIELGTCPVLFRKIVVIHYVNGTSVTKYLSELSDDEIRELFYH